MGRIPRRVGFDGALPGILGRRFLPLGRLARRRKPTRGSSTRPADRSGPPTPGWWTGPGWPAWGTEATTWAPGPARSGTTCGPWPGPPGVGHAAGAAGRPGPVPGPVAGPAAGPARPRALAGHAERAELRRLVEAWGGRAAVASAGSRMVRGFRLVLQEELSEPFARAFRLGPQRRFRAGFAGQSEGPLWALATQRPPNLLDPRFRHWDAQLLRAVDGDIARLTKDGAPGPVHLGPPEHPPDPAPPGPGPALPGPLAGHAAPAHPRRQPQMPRVQDRISGLPSACRLPGA